MALQASNLPMDTRDKERKPRQMMASCSPKLRSDPTFSIGLFSPLGPHSGSGAVPRTPALPGYCRGIAGTQFTRTCAPARAHARARRRVRAQARMCHSAKGSCNPTRLLEAAELLEADQRKHEGGQSKETSSVLDSTSFGSVPMIFWSRRLVARPDRPWLSKPMTF